MALYEFGTQQLSMLLVYSNTGKVHQGIYFNTEYNFWASFFFPMNLLIREKVYHAFLEKY